MMCGGSSRLINEANNQLLKFKKQGKTFRQRKFANCPLLILKTMTLVNPVYLFCSCMPKKAGHGSFIHSFIL